MQSTNTARDLTPAPAPIPTPTITYQEAPIRHFLPGKMLTLDAVKTAFTDALAGKGKLPQHLIEMEGLSGIKYRTFINNLVGNLANPRYLEVGSWSGSTLCAAISGNDVTACAIDNWSQFGGPMDKFFYNLSRNCSPQTRVSIVNSDFRRVNFASLGKFNIYLFDGPHAFEDQRDGLMMALDCLDDEFVFIVDDWNWEAVRQGTMTAIALAGLPVMWSVEIRSSDDNTQPAAMGHTGDWHNGYFIALLKK
jgi:hypothetical protein